MSLILDGTTGVPVTTVTGTLPEANGGTGTTVGYCGFKNRIINGGMVIDQRNAGASVTPSASSGNNYLTDRWSYIPTQASKFTFQQLSTTPPVGFNTYLSATVASAVSVGASDNFSVRQYIEGFNFADLGFGTANAQTVTLSFWVKSSLTGTFGGAFGNYAGTRSYPFNYTISSANTWEQKSVTIVGDTGGTWVGATNAGAAILNFGLGCGSTLSGTAGSWSSNYYIQSTGSVSVIGTNGATFYITGVQLERGSTATSFDYRPYGTELALCQRYFQKATGMMGAGQATTTVSSVINFSVEMRASPTLSLSAAAKFSDFTTADYTQSSASAVINSGTRVTPQGVFVNFANFTGLTLNRPIGMIPNESGILLISSEL